MSSGILYNGTIRKRELALLIWLLHTFGIVLSRNILGYATGVQNTKERRIGSVGFLDIMSRIVSILVGVATLAEKCKPYIEGFRKRTEKDPSTNSQGSDGPKDDYKNNR